MNALDDIRALGYSVGLACNEDNPDAPTIYRITGYGADLHVREDDTEILDSLRDPQAHKTRVFMYEHPEAGEAIAALGGRGIPVQIDADNQKLLVTKPGDTNPTAYTPGQAQAYFDSLPAFDPYADVRQQLAAATTLPQMQAAIGNLLDQLPQAP